MANRNFANSRMYTGHVMPVLLDCNFVVDATNGNGLGIRSLKGPYVQAVYMHTSASPAAGSPAPAAGIIVVQLQDGYTRSYGGGYSIISPAGSSQIISSGLTAGLAYIITVLGDATAADWLALGVPAGVVPAVGVSFIAAAVGAGASASARVAPPAAAGSAIMSIETVGDPNLSISPMPSAQSFGAQIILECRDKTGALAAPAAGSVIALEFLLGNSSVMIGGE